ncbi:uncharacterized protein PAC_11828 [Phialocephala subalpina]|uniref:Beta-lactamase-related domain-containing protein n=1 Tax=Phialocephala subalpina TaxID=576137 RepID=A0A1L7XA79_9HELO|nr:uncharacterized protein PAC_11828 [Phialocephala subalpina]
MLCVNKHEKGAISHVEYALSYLTTTSLEVFEPEAHTKVKMHRPWLKKYLRGHRGHRGREVKLNSVLNHLKTRSLNNEAYKFKIKVLEERFTSYNYGAGIGWVGIMTCRVNNNLFLEDYILASICAPLDIKSITFHHDQHLEIKAKLAGTAIAAYLQEILSSLTLNDGTLLKPATVLEMHKPRMSPEAQKALMQFREVPQQVQLTAQGQTMGAKLHYGLGACLNLTATSEEKHNGMLSWSGLPNVYWWIAQEAGVSGTLFMTLFPMGDEVANEFSICFRERSMTLLRNKKALAAPSRVSCCGIDS